MARLGETSLTDKKSGEARVIKIVEEFVHPDYKPPKNYNDIAILKLETPVTFSTRIRPACLPKSLEDNNLPLELTAVGWGKTSFGNLVFIALFLIFKRAITITVLEYSKLLQI